MLYSAGVCPTIRVSHVDELAALEHAAEQAGVGVDELSVRQRVIVLAEAKAQAVYRRYRNVAEAAAAATGERVTAYPLKAAGVGDAGSVPSSSDPTAVSTSASSSASPASGVTGGKAYDITRDFSGVDVPTTVEPIHTPADGAGKGGSGVNGTDADDTGSTGANGSGTNNASAIQGLTTAAVGPLILGCDSMFLFNGECHGKPHSADVARERLRAMRGHSGELWTGHCLIDFATGRVARGASHAIVHFSDYSDRDIERYIATGEPLEVAGSFSLEGFGGAFIDGIEGDPHGIIGLSLPLARRLAGELGVEWTDLWNVARGDHDPAPKSDGVTSFAAGSVPPKENVHQPGDGFVDLRLRPPSLGTQWRLRRAAGPSGRRDGPRDACGHAASRAVERRRRHLGHSGRRHGGRRERYRGRAARKLRGGQHHPRGHRGGRRLPGGPRQLGLHHRVRVREARPHGHAAHQ